jgi:hypothetical protein
MNKNKSNKINIFNLLSIFVLIFFICFALFYWKINQIFIFAIEKDNFYLAKLCLILKKDIINLNIFEKEGFGNPVYLKIVRENIKVFFGLILENINYIKIKLNVGPMFGYLMNNDNYKEAEFLLDSYPVYFTHYHLLKYLKEIERKLPHHPDKKQLNLLEIKIEIILKNKSYSKIQI